MYVDPDGKKFDDANELIAQNFERQISIKLDDSELRHREKRQLYNSLQDFQNMREDVYRNYVFQIINDDAQPQINISINNGVTTVFINYDGTTYGALHESRHGGQIARNELLYNEVGDFTNYNVRHEIEAYKAEFSYRGELYYTIKVQNEISAAFEAYLTARVSNIKEIKKNLIRKMYEPYYKDIKQRPIYPTSASFYRRMRNKKK